MRPWRSRWGRRLYETLLHRGLVVARLVEYVAERPFSNYPDSPARLSHYAPGVVPPAGTPVSADRDEDEHAVVAWVDGDPVGSVLVGVDAARRVAPLERTLRFDGAYLRRLRVTPAYRRIGVGTALVAAAADCPDYTRATALVGADNRASRGLFESLGFTARRIRTRVRAGPVAARRVVEVAEPTPHVVQSSVGLSVRR